MDLRGRNLQPVGREGKVGRDTAGAGIKRHPSRKAVRDVLGAIACLALLSFATLANLSAAAQAHDIYSGLFSNYGTACCDDSDCRPAHYRVTKSGVRMQVDNKWISVPPSAVQYRILSGDRGETAGGHWCGRRANDVEELNDPLENGYFTFCAILPPSFAAATANGSP